MKATIASLLFLTDYSLGSASHWDYAHFGGDWSHDFEMCATSDQSPINIESYDAIYAHNKCDATFEWDVDYTHQTFKVANNGHSISFKAVTETNIDPDHELDGTLDGSDGTEYMTLAENENTIASFPNYHKPSSSEHDRFCLDSFHFHWGLDDNTGSEHLVNDHQYPLEVHFVHYSCAHSTLGSTLEQFPSGESVSTAEDDGIDTHQLGVVGIFFDIVEENNPAFDAIFTNDTLEHIMLPDSHSNEIVFGLNLDDIIPDDIATAGYYAYEGSLTTPPCTDIVRWHVMNARSYIGREQIEKFRELMSTEEISLAPNYREVQSNDKEVYACMGIMAEEEVSGTEEDNKTMPWWTVAIVSSIITAVVLSVIFMYMYWKQSIGYQEDIVNAKRASNKNDPETYDGGYTR